MKTAAEIARDNFPTGEERNEQRGREGGEEEEKVVEEERSGGERARQASRHSPFVARLANLEEGRCQ